MHSDCHWIMIHYQSYECPRTNTGVRPFLIPPEWQGRILIAHQLQWVLSFFSKSLLKGFYNEKYLKFSWTEHRSLYCAKWCYCRSNYKSCIRFEFLLVKDKSIREHYVINKKYYWPFLSTGYRNLNIITLVACICHIIPTIKSFS